MEISNATVALAALGQTTRLAVFRLLVEAGPDGRMAGEIAEALVLPGATCPPPDWCRASRAGGMSATAPTSTR
jgi:hypothetical protein